MTYRSRKTAVLVATTLIAILLATSQNAIATSVKDAHWTQYYEAIDQRAVAFARDALKAADAGNFDRAHALARQSGLPLAGKLVRWMELSRPEEGGDFRRTRRFLAANRHWPWQWNLRRRVELALDGTQKPEEVVSWFRENPPLSYQGASAFADALERLGRYDEAAGVLRRHWIEGPLNRAEEQALLRRIGSGLSRQDHLARLERLLWSDQGYAAQRQGRRLGPPYRELADARVALAFMRPGVDSRITAVAKELRGDSGLIYDRARWRMRKGRYEGVVELLKGLPGELPYPESWWDLRHWTARQALSRGDVSLAYDMASAHGMSRGIAFAEGEFLAGWIALRYLRKPDLALEHFRRLYENVKTPVSLGRGAYWAARAAAASGQSGLSRSWYAEAARYPTSFYGQLAAVALRGTVDPGLDESSQPSPAQRHAFAGRELSRVLSLLAALGEAERMEPFVSELAGNAGSELDFRLLADHLERIGRTDMAVAIARKARTRGYILPYHLYPLPPALKELVTTRPGGPEPALLLSVIRQESGFDPSAVSGAGARGLMQIMPATARQVALTLKIGYSREKLLKDPAYNLAIGRAYLEELIAGYDGSIVLALAAYNAGPGNVRRWLQRYGDPRADWVSAIDWIESLPLDETRNYVQRVLEALPFYRQRLMQTQLAANLLPELTAEVKATQNLSR